jgi:hypothetical protein
VCWPHSQLATCRERSRVSSFFTRSYCLGRLNNTSRPGKRIRIVGIGGLGCILILIILCRRSSCQSFFHPVRLCFGSRASHRLLAFSGQDGIHYPTDLGNLPLTPASFQEDALEMGATDFGLTGNQVSLTSGKEN